VPTTLQISSPTVIDKLPIVGPQLGIWLADQLATNSNTFTVAQYVELCGDIDVITLQAAIKLGLAEADTVHSLYENTAEGSIQIIPELPSVDQLLDPEFVDLSLLENDEAQAISLMHNDIEQAKRAGDTEPLYHQKIIKLASKEGKQRWFWYQRYHHLTIDGFSFTALTQRISDIYRKLIANKIIDVSPFTPYRHVIDEYVAYEKSKKKEKDREFWQNYCTNIPSQISLSYKPSTSADGLNTAVIRHQFSLPKHVYQQIEQHADFSMVDIASAVILVYLSKVTRQETVCIGYPLMRRMGSQALTTLGTAVNVLPLVVQFIPEHTLNNAIRLLTQEVKKIRRHQQYEGEQIQRDAGLAGEKNRLYSATLNCKLFDYTLDFSGIAGSTHQLATGPIEDIEFGVYALEGKLSIELAANSSRYSDEDIKLHGQRILQLLRQYGLDTECNVERTLESLSIMTTQEASNIAKWSTGSRLSTEGYGNSIVDLLGQQATRQGSNTAIVFEKQHVSFEQFSNRVNQLSRMLLANGVKSGDIVAVALPRSIESILSIYAIMSCGAVYLPLDLNHPPERLAMMCEDKIPRIAITLKTQQRLLPSSIDTLRLDDQSTLALLNACYVTPLAMNACLVDKNDIAYVFYTSGSTGRPKGVMVSHGALINLVTALDEKVYSCINNSDDVDRSNGKAIKQLNVALTGSLSFDTSWDPILLMSLGHTLHLYADDVKQDVYALLDIIDKDKIDTLALAPSLATQLVQAGLCDVGRHQPRLMTICGEPVPLSLWQALQHSLISAHNIYGPTEFTVYATSKAITPELSDVVIGRPFANTRVYVLDEKLAPVGVGVNGELYLAGDNMSAGYLNRPEVTATRFVANPFVAAELMYMTGDIVRWSTDGELVFVGRCDNQIKVRGFRIELGDVESALSCLDIINEVVVLADSTESGNRLLAYCTLSNDTTVDESLPNDQLSKEQVVESINQQLALRLPAYMIPAVITILPEMPLTVSGKINKKILPKPLIENQSLALPSTRAEVILCEAIATVLALDTVGLNDDFFKLAGDSISAMRLSIAMHQKGFVLKPQNIFTERTPDKMAASMTELSTLTDNESHEINRYTAASDNDDVLHNIHQNLSMMPTPNEVKLLVEHYGEQAIILPTLPLQAGLLFHAQLSDVGNQYSFTTKLTLHGEVNTALLQEAIACILVKYPQLMAKFDTELTGKPLQLIPFVTLEKARQHCPISELDFRGMHEELKQQSLHSFEMAEAYRHFDLSAPPSSSTSAITATEKRLFFVSLVRMDDAKYELVITAHHLIIDGWSTPILLRDLLNTYHSVENLKLNVVNNYQDIVYQMVNRSIDEAKLQWKSTLAHVTPTIVYPESKQSTTISELHLSLNIELTRQVEQYCQQQGITLNTLIQGVWAAQLGSMTGRNNVVFGSPVSGRFSNISGIDEQIGLFSNTLPVSVKLNTDETILSQLIKLQIQQINLMSHDNIGLGEIQRLVNVDNLFDTLLVVENYPAQQSLFTQSFSGVSIKHVENRGYTHYPLTILVLPGESIRVLFEYTEVVSEPDNLAKRFTHIIEQIVNDPLLTLAKLTMQTEEDIRVIDAANDTQVAVPNKSLRDLLRMQANKTPSLIALKDDMRALTYKEMRSTVKYMSKKLQPYMNTSVGIVGVAIPRSCELSLALQSVIEIGAAYLPLDSTYPNNRLAMMLSDAKVNILLTTRAQFSRFTGEDFNQLAVNVILIESLIDTINTPDTSTPDISAADNHQSAIEQDISPNDAAYVIYTSGSTGRPKGVVVSHRAIVNRLLWMQNEYCLAQTDVVLQKTPSSFDVSVWEFFWPLIQGACLYMASPEAHRDPEELLDIIVSEKITTMHFVPSMLAAFIDSVEHSSRLPQMNSVLQRVFCSGEALSVDLSEKFQSICDAPLHNLYGPTEAAVDVTYYAAASAIGTKHKGVPIGSPVWNTQLRILDHQLRAVGVGVIGELYLTGQQLANGYLNRQELTAERFVADPFEDGQRMYRTGDIAQWLPDGNVVYLGRTDDQLKIRGLRVEIGEIEQVLLQIEQIKQVVVHARVLAHSTSTNQLEDNRQLVGYYVRDMAVIAPISHEQILKEMSLLLPAHMIPVALVEVSEFPLSANGKLDKKSLPDPKQNADSSGREPSAGAETIIAQAFAKLLNIDNVSAQDNFFSLGGHSLMAMKLAAQLRSTLALPVSVGQIMVSPTVAGLAEVLVDETLRQDPAKAGFGHILPIRQGQGTPLVCINPGSGFSWQYTGFPKYLKGNYPIIGLQSPRPNGAVAVSADMAAAIEHYYAALKRVQPKGPYHFLGYSFGGTVAMALASKLESQSEQVAFVGLIDTYPPEGQEWKRPTEAEAKEEVEREKRQFLAAANNELSDEVSLAEQNKMFADIVANYDDTVRLLSNATTQNYQGKVHLFVAEKTLPKDWNVKKSWAPFVRNLVQFRLPFAHDDILSPESLKSVGPVLNELINTKLK